MAEYKIKWYTYDNPELEFISEEIEIGGYNIIDRSYEFSGFEVTILDSEIDDYLRVNNSNFDTVIYGVKSNSPSILQDREFGRLYYNSYPPLPDGTEISIGDEILRAGTDGNNVKYLDRGMYNTRARSIGLKRGDTIIATAGGRVTPVGLEGMLYYKNTNNEWAEFGIVYIESLYSSGAGITITLNTLINKFDKDIIIKDDTAIFNDGTNLYVAIDNFQSWLGVRYGFNNNDNSSIGVGDVQVTNRIDNIISASVVGNRTLTLNLGTLEDLGQSDIAVVNPFEILLTMLDLTNNILNINNNGGIETININTFSAFNTYLDLGNIYNYFDLDEGGYESTVNTLSYTTVLKYKNDSGGETTEKIGSSGAQTMLEETREIDLTGYKQDELNLEVIRRYLNQFTQIFGMVKGHITLNVAPNHNIQAGKYYHIDNFTSQKEFMIFTDYAEDLLLFCYSASNNSIKMLLISASAYNPVSPSFIGVATDTNELQVISEIKLNEQLLTFETDDIEHASNYDLDYTFFEDNENIEIRQIDNYDKISDANITSLTNDTVKVNTTNLTIGNYYIVTYPNKNNADNKQNKHLYTNIGVY